MLRAGGPYRDPLDAVAEAQHAERLGIGAMFLPTIRGVLCAVGALVLCRLRTPSCRTDNPSFLCELRAGWREYASIRWVWIMTRQDTAVIIAMVAYTDIAGPIYMDDHHGGARAWGPSPPANTSAHWREP